MEQNFNEQELLRREALGKLRDLGIEPYPAPLYPVNATAKEVKEKFDPEKGELPDLCLAGRLMSRRIMGAASFAEIQDESGRIQIYVNRDEICPGEDKTMYNTVFKKLLDIGDVVGVKGFAFVTKTGQLSIHVKELTLLSKSLRVLPIVKEQDGKVFDAFSDPELRYRQRYVDLIVNPQVKETFIKRAKIIATMREYFNAAGCLEVETPILQSIPGGAAARPFITHHNALDIDMYMRIAPELYLKRLVVGGFERVFELNRNFRNEGIDVRHNPEFTMMEFYMAYADYHDLIDFTENMLRHLATAVLGDPVIRYGKEGEEPLIIDFSKPFARLTMREAILKYAKGITEDDLNDFDRACAYAKKIGIEIMKGWKLGHVFAAIFEETCEANLIQPTFITEYPAEVSPLARRNDENPAFCDRFEFYIAGRELGNAFSELNDADDQASRFQAQVDQKKAGDEEAMYFDHDYITALEYGLPPTAGEGIGIDRLAMLFTNSQTIRDVILFPTLRPQAKN